MIVLYCEVHREYTGDTRRMIARLSSRRRRGAVIAPGPPVLADLAP